MGLKARELKIDFIRSAQAFGQNPRLTVYGPRTVYDQRDTSTDVTLFLPEASFAVFARKIGE